MSTKYDAIIRTLMNRLNIAKERITKLNLELHTLKTTLSPTAAVNTTLWNVVVAKGLKSIPKDQEQMNIINTIALESKQRENRAKNKIIRGALKSPSTEPSIAKAQDRSEEEKIFSLLRTEKSLIVNHFRLKPNVRTLELRSPIVVTLTNESARNRVLKQASTFFSVTNNRINRSSLFINPYITLNEHNLAYRLRTECKKRNAAHSPIAITINVIRGNTIKEITRHH